MGLEIFREATGLFLVGLILLGLKLSLWLFLLGLKKLISTYFDQALMPLHEVIGLQREGLCALLSHYLRQEMKGYLERGELSLSEHDELSLFYQTYEALGGNGTAKALYEACQALPFQREEEEDDKD